MINSRPAAHPGQCTKQGCANPAIAPGDLIGYYKHQLMHAACANWCAGTLTEYADSERRRIAFRDRHRAEVDRHRALLAKAVA